MREVAQYLLGVAAFHVFVVSSKVYAWCNYRRARTTVWFDVFGYPVTTITMRHWTAHDPSTDEGGVEAVRETVEQKPWGW